MKKILLLLLFINISCAQDDTTINETKDEIYDLELIHPTKNIPWSIEFIDENEKVLILYGDVPLIRKSTLKKLFSLNDSLSILSSLLTE